MSDIQLPLVMSATGPVPLAPADINANIIAYAQNVSPGLTVLPAGLIEDFTSTTTGAVYLCDQARIEAINSVTPLGCNAYMLNQQGQLYGIKQGVGTNTSVNVVFTGTPEFFIPVGFTVSDGTYQYIVQDAVTIPESGTSAVTYCLAVQTGSWPIPANTVTKLVTSVPSNITLSVNNPNSGTSATTAQSVQDYRAQVLLSGKAAATGWISQLKAQLYNLPGVQPRLISVRQQSNGYEIICGGGDPYQVANAIFTAQFYIPGIVGSTLSITNITNANPGVVTTNLNHGYATGATIKLQNVAGMTQVNNVPKTITVIDEKNFSIGDTSNYGAYTSGGIATPNPRNVTIGIAQYPDTYSVTFVNPPMQTVNVSLVWNTDSPNYVAPGTISQLGVAAIVDYINSIPVGYPINIYQLQSVFASAVSGAIPTYLLTKIVPTISINNISTPPETGTGIVNGDPESYFLTDSTKISIVQG